MDRAWQLPGSGIQGLRFIGLRDSRHIRCIGFWGFMGVRDRRDSDIGRVCGAWGLKGLGCIVHRVLKTSGLGAV